MNKMKPRLFGKMWLYTLLFLSAAIVAFTFFYAKELSLTFALYERRQLAYELQTLLGSLEGKTRSEKIEAISDFSTQSKTFAFSIRTNQGEIIYETPEFTMNETSLKDLLKNRDIVLKDLQEYDFGFSLPVDNNIILYIARYPRSGIPYDVFMQILPLSLILLGTSIAGAFLFARLMSKPIKRLAEDTVKMSKLESVENPPLRSDEIGLLADNVHAMYAKLKSTIAELENEIKQEKEMEEKQRYFFSAASHELKTPVAAVTAIIEGFIGINEAVASSVAADYNSLLGTAITLQINDDVSSLTKTFLISGIIENNGTVADRFRTAYILFDDLVPMYGSGYPPVHTVYVTAESQSAVAGIKSRLSALGFHSGSRDAALDRILSFIDIVTAGLTGIAAVSLVVSGIMILVVLFISVIERTKEIGILRALGARASDIRRVFMMEGALLGFGSGFVGVVMAVLLGLAVNFVTLRRMGVGIVSVNAGHMIDGLLIGLGVSIPASLFPAAKASKLDPVESLRHE